MQRLRLSLPIRHGIPTMTPFKSCIKSRESFRNSAAYIQGWLKSLRNDKRLIVMAAGAAEKAVKFILNEKEDLPCECDE